MTSEELIKHQSEMSDSDLINTCSKELSRLCKTGGNSFKMTVPVNILDTDMLFSELIKRYKEKLTS